MQKSKTLKQIAALLLAGALSVGLFAGCNGGTSSSSAPAESTASSASESESEAPASESEAASEAPATEGGEATIRMAWWGNQLRNDGTVAMLDAFVAENPNVKYEAEFTDWSGYWDKLATQAASNNLPDIIQQDYMYIAQYHAKGQLASLTEQVTAGNLNIDNVSESILATGSFDGELFALCAGVNAVGMLYNVRMAEEAGVTIPERFTYDELMALNAQVFEATGIKGMTPAGGGGMQMMCRDVGELYLDPETNTMTASETTVNKYFQQVKATIDSPWSVSVDIMQEDVTSGVENSSISTMKTWNFYPGGSNQVAAYEAPMDDSLDMAMYPKRDDATQESMYLRPSQFWSITATSEHKDVAARIIDYFTNNEKAQDILQAERGVPVSSVMAEYLQPQLDEVQQRVFAYIAEVTEVAVPFDPPQPNGTNEVNKLLDDLTDLVRYGELTPEAAAERFLAEADGILASANA
ncbi:MAG: ABC transporter substrate-binding protein [Oscillospiraceae bacterium]